MKVESSRMFSVTLFTPYDLEAIVIAICFSISGFRIQVNAESSLF